jgi:hypothetical protein
MATATVTPTLDVDAVLADLYRMHAEAHRAYLAAGTPPPHLSILCSALGVALEAAEMVRDDAKATDTDADQ